MNSLPKPLLAVGVSCALFVAVYSVNAQTPAPTSTEPAEATTTPLIAADGEQDLRQAKLEEALARAGENAPLSVSRQKRIVNLSANLSNRMDAAWWRFENIANRLESRMLKTETAGADTSQARVALSDARSSLDIAANLLKDIDNTVITSVTANNPVESIAELRATYEAIAVALRQAHSSLRIALALTRTASITPTVTSTPEETAGTDNLQ